MPAKREIETPKRQSETGGSLLYKILSVILAVIVIVQAVYIFYPSSTISQVSSIAIPDLSTSGFDKVSKVVAVSDTGSGSGSLALDSGCSELAAVVESYQADSINNGLHGTVGPRPDAHDMAVDVFRALKIDVIMVKITARQNDLFLSKLVLRQGNTILNFDARPSDAVAIAVRMKADIYVNDTLMKTEGKSIC